MQEIKYSFVLPAYKARFFREAIDSILAQTYKDFELIIVNDASPEDLDSIVNSYNDSRIRYYVNEQNIGGKDLVAQWNHCLEYAKGEYIILASDDDVYFPQYLEKMDALVQKYPEVNVFRPRYRGIDENGNVQYETIRCNIKISAVEFVYLLMECNIGSGIPFYVFNKDKLISLGGFVNFPMGWGADDATVMLMAKNGMCIEDEVLFSFRMSGINISTRHDLSVVKKKIQSDRLLYKFYQEYINTLPIESDEDKSNIVFLKNNCKKTFRSRTASELNLMSFGEAIKITPKLLRLPWSNTFFILKRIFKKVFQIIMTE